MFSLFQLVTSVIDNCKWIVKPQPQTLESVLSEFHLDNETLRRLMKEMMNQMELGLIGGLKYSSIAMLPSFVPWFYDTNLDNDEEPERYLALDLGGTNLRVMLLEVGRRDGKLYSESRNFRIPNAAMVGSANDLFNFIVGCIENFLNEKSLMHAHLSLGFTFSYPCQQNGLASAVLVRWTKGFNIKEVEGQDIVALLQNAIDKNGKMKVRVVALMNDTVGTQVATAFDHGCCDLAVVVATGTNASYMESVVNVKKLDAAINYPFENMIIDTEWGGFGDKGEIEFVRTEYDRTVDLNSVHPGVQSFDKLVAGMYMGELIRLVLVKLTRYKLIFNNCEHGLLVKSGAFPTKYISEILNDEGGRLNTTRQICEEIGIDGFSYSDLILLREICMCISRRSANFVAAAISAALTRLKKNRVTVGIDGTTYRFHPFYHLWVKDKIKELLPPNYEVNLVQAGDGSGKGAALVAAIADKISEMNRASHVVRHSSISDENFDVINGN